MARGPMRFFGLPLISYLPVRYGTTPKRFLTLNGEKNGRVDIGVVTIV
jgi:hypothetical protein